MKKLNDDRKAALFKQLASKTLIEAGIHFDLDKYYSNPKSIKNAVYGIYNEVRANPERFAIQTETVDLVVKAVSERKVATIQPPLKKNNEDVKDMILRGRNTSMMLINRKLDQLDKSKKALKNESLVSLGKIFGIIFDKAQIIQGQATEHVAMLSKIDSNIEPGKAIDMVLKMREIENSK